MNGVFVWSNYNMVQGHFYFLKDDFFIDFPDKNIQKNHEMINGVPHDKPCFCAIKGDKDVFWLVPISSQTAKYHSLEHKKILKYGKCDTIKFGEVLGYEKAFLIQNMIPVTDKYIKSEYVDKNNNPVRVDGAFELVLIKTALEVLAKQRKGVKLVFPDILVMEGILIERQQ